MIDPYYNSLLFKKDEIIYIQKLDPRRTFGYVLVVEDSPEDIPYIRFIKKNNRGVILVEGSISKFLCNHVNREDVSSDIIRLYS